MAARRQVTHLIQLVHSGADSAEFILGHSAAGKHAV